MSSLGRTQERTMSKKNVILRALFVALALVATTSSASAQSGRVTLDAYRPATRARDGFAVSTADVDRHLGLSGTLILDYANDPLVYEVAAGSSSSEVRVVNHQLVGHAMFTIGLIDRLQLHVGLPVNFLQRGDSTSGIPGQVASADGAGLGDAWIGARARLVGDAESRFGLGAQVTMTLPTGRAANGSEHYSGEHTVTVSPSVMAHVNIGILRVALNVGARVRNNQQFLGVNRADELTYGAAAIFRLAEDRVQVSGELFGSMSFRDLDNHNAPFEGLVGAKYFHDSGAYFGGSLGMGLVRGLGSPDFRGLLVVGYASPAEPEPVEPPPPPGPVDTDGDGLMDPDDQCPNEPEDVDTFEDENGCPDPDNDQDGVLDVNDGAPMIPEDHDEFEDTDGVPDPDNDQDGVLDVDDHCPLVVGMVEDQGCPPPDRDGDTVIDREDNCPDEPGTVPNHGCREVQQVVIQGDMLEIVDNIYFRTNRDVIEPRSFALLDQVASVIVAHPEIPRVRVEGHTDARGSRTRNLRLSQQRAAAVVRYLTAHGVAAERLESAGFGPDRPVVPNATTPEEHARNRRVEFHIEGLAVEHGGRGPDADTIDR